MRTRTKERDRTLMVRATAEEVARAHRLAEDTGEPFAILFRRWLNETYRTRFGAEPAARR